MAKKDSEIGKAQTILCIIVSCIFIIGALFGVNSYFAKDSEFQIVTIKSKKNDQLLSERLDIAILEDDIKYQQRQIERIEDWSRIEQKVEKPEFTLIEKEALDKAKKELQKLEKERAEKKKLYETIRSG